MSSSKSTTTIPQKRARSPETEEAEDETGGIPPEDCTRHTFDQHAANLSDRQFLCWALQTEARVRFAKLQGRDQVCDESFSTTLNSEHLIDLYPSDGAAAKVTTEGALARERHAFARKSIPYLRQMRDRDSSFQGLTHVEPNRERQSILAKSNRKMGVSLQHLPIPPNFLFFEIILEAFMGYQVPSYNSVDPTQPRAAVMGGAIVAVLTSWRDATVVSTFQEAEDRLQEALELGDVDRFHMMRERVLRRLHHYFLHEGTSNSPFSMGDVDIFLQASPFTRSLMTKMADLPTEVLDGVSSFLRGCHYVGQDLRTFATSLCRDHLEPKFEDKFTDSYDYYRCQGESKSHFCYALATNGLSFALGTPIKEPKFDPEQDTWPRTTQLIILNEKADLVGALMDFDISVASCAYDGLTVYATPRAAFSLKTLTQVATPFVYEEKRNRSRITKYYQRGFDAFIVDPCCFHESQCFSDSAITAEESTEFTDRRFGTWMSLSLTSWERYNEICNAQRREGGDLIYICDFGHSDSDSTSLDEENLRMLVTMTHQYSRHHNYHPYTVALFEQSEGHAIEYFAKRDEWSEDIRREVMSHSENLRVACRTCRKEYGLQLALEEAPVCIQSAETVEDVLHGPCSYSHSVGRCGDFDPSFYGAGAFSSYFVGRNARTWYQLLGVMHSQLIVEEARYIRRHGSLNGYTPRFIYRDDLADLFFAAETQELPANGRAPVGLNPERFIAKCKGCEQWLHGKEFHVQYCDKCIESKAAAVDN